MRILPIGDGHPVVDERRFRLSLSVIQHFGGSLNAGCTAQEIFLLDLGP
jgi:hypothetical protein